MFPHLDAIVFDVGNVLLDWNPRHLYNKLIDDQQERESFLSSVCTPAWNVQQDLGRTWKEGTDLLIAEHPDKADLILAFDHRWEETVSGPIDGSVSLLEDLHTAGVPLYSITNFSAEKFPIMRERYAFFDRFRDIVVSGEERMIKPSPEIYRLLADRAGLDLKACLFIDDSEINIAGARAVGMQVHHFTGPTRLHADLEARGYSVAPV